MEHKIDRFLFGKRVRAAREAKGLTQQQLGELCGVSAVTVISYEKGQKLPHLEVADRLAGALEVSLDRLCGRARVPACDKSSAVEALADMLLSGAFLVNQGGNHSLVPQDEIFHKVLDVFCLCRDGTIPKRLFELYVMDAAKQLAENGGRKTDVKPSDIDGPACGRSGAADDAERGVGDLVPDCSGPDV